MAYMNQNALWLDKGVAKYYRNGKWVTIIAAQVNSEVCGVLTS